MLKRICQSRKLAELKSDGARLLHTWLLPNVDINGCFSGDAEVIKGQIFTRLKKPTKTIQSYLHDLNNTGLIVWYKSNGDDYLWIPDFVDKQPSLNPEREAEPTIPMPTPDQLQSKSVATPLKVKESKEKVKQSKDKYMEFVFLTLEEHTKLKNLFGTEAILKEKISALNDYVGSTGKTYKSHYHTLLSWDRRNNSATDPQSSKKTLQKQRIQEAGARLLAEEERDKK